jgi:hypothetical protein
MFRIFSTPVNIPTKQFILALFQLKCWFNRFDSSLIRCILPLYLYQSGILQYFQQNSIFVMYRGIFGKWLFNSEWAGKTSIQPKRVTNKR